MSLEWKFVSGEAAWLSAAHQWLHGRVLEWIICIRDDGLFDVSESSSELFPDHPPKPFTTLAAAKTWCEQRQAELCEKAKAAQ